MLSGFPNSAEHWCSVETLKNNIFIHYISDKPSVDILNWIHWLFKQLLRTTMSNCRLDKSRELNILWVFHQDSFPTVLL